MITRTKIRSNNAERWGGEGWGAVEIISDLLYLNLELGQRAQLYSAGKVRY